MGTADAKQLLDENGHLVQFQYYDATSGQYLPVNSANPLPTSGGGGGGGGGLNTYAITQTVLAVTTASQQLVPANPARKYLAWMVIGSADVTVAPGATGAVFGVGQIYQAGGAAPDKQGGSEEFPQGVPTNAFSVIALATGSSVVVWEGA